jgi:TPR repeat protein
MTKASIALAGLIAAGIVGWLGWAAWQDHARETVYLDGLALVDEGRYEEALALATPYAESGDPNFDHLMAEILLAAPEPLGDDQRGLDFQRRAAEAGQHRAGARLARRILANDPSRDEFDVAYRYLTAAADCGMPDAHFQLGMVTMRSDYIEPDLLAAFYLFSVAAYSGEPTAQWNAGSAALLLFHERGEKDEVLLIHALAWRLAAAESGNPRALEYLDELNQEEGAEDDKFFQQAKLEAAKLLDLVNSFDRFQCGFVSPVTPLGL